MTRDSITYGILRQLVEEHFDFLLAGGFHFLDERRSNDPVLFVVMIAGKNVALRLTYDRRDRVCDIGVGKTQGDPTEPFGLDLGSYLHDYCGYRGGYSDGMTTAQLKTLAPKVRLARDIRWFAGIIQARAPRIVDDTEDFKSRTPSDGKSRTP